MKERASSDEKKCNPVLTKHFGRQTVEVRLTCGRFSAGFLTRHILNFGTSNGDIFRRSWRVSQASWPFDYEARLQPRGSRMPGRIPEIDSRRRTSPRRASE